MSLMRLHRLVRDYRGPLRADLRREYGIDLDAVLTHRTIKPGVLLDLIDGLSPGSALGRAVDPSSAWSLTEHMLATIIDQNNLALWQRGGKGKRPDPLPRPGDKQTGDVMGASEGFDTIAEFELWYRVRTDGQPDSPATQTA